MEYTNSSLVSYTALSPNHSGQRNHVIDTITIHCVVGQLSVETIGNIFKPESRQASCNYAIGVDGRIALIVEEKNRSWCSSSSSNDHRAITIECASDKTEPYAVNDAVYASLIKLLVDICKRNGIPKLLWQGDKSLIGQVDKQNMTVHKWFKNKSCPGSYLYGLHGQIAAEVNAQLGVEEEGTGSGSTSADHPEVPFRVRVANVEADDVLNIREEPDYKSEKTGELAYNDPNWYTIVEVKDGWGRLKSGVGWINLKYTVLVTDEDEDENVTGGTDAGAQKPKEDSTQQVEVPFMIRVANVAPDDVLNIRKEPNAESEKTGELAYNDPNLYTIVEVQGVWGRLKSGVGWINLNYTTAPNVSNNQQSSQPKPSASTSTVTKKSLEDVAREIVAGKGGWGNGSDRKARLEAAGYNYEKVQALVNKLMRGEKLTTSTYPTSNPKADEIEVGDTVKVKNGAPNYSGVSLKSFVYERNHIVRSVTGERVVITYNGVVIAAVHKSNLILVAKKK